MAGLWFAMTAKFCEDPKIEALGERFGPGGPFAIVVLLGEAKLQSHGGRVEGSYRALASSAFLDGREQAREIIETAQEVELLHGIQLTERGFEVQLGRSLWPGRRSLSRRIRELIIARDKSVCGLCGRHVARADVHIDHIVPWSLGGSDDPSNLQVAHAFCNLSKGARV